MERAILVELPSDGSDDQISSVAWRVARRFDWGIWTVDSHKGKLTPERYAEIANFVLNNPRHRRHPEKLENKFRSSFSRALKRLEQKGLVDRFQESVFERRDDQLFRVMYKVKGSSRHCRTVRVRLSGELEDGGCAVSAKAYLLRSKFDD